MLRKARARQKAAELLGTLPQRPPTFCIGCPERPTFAALKLAQQDIGPQAAAGAGGQDAES